MSENKICVRTLVLGMMQTNCYIVFPQNMGEAVIIDPADRAERICQAVKESGAEPKAVLLTHGHFDHIGAAMEIKRTFGIPVYAGEMEKEVLNSAYNNLSMMMGSDGFAIEADTYLTDGEKLSAAGFEISTIATPGHTKGGVSYLFSLEGEQVLFSGDTLFAGSVGRYDFPTSSGTALFASIRQKLMKLRDDVIVYPGHGMSTTIGDERPRFLS